MKRELRFKPSMSTSPAFGKGLVLVASVAMEGRELHPPELDLLPRTMLATV